MNPGRPGGHFRKMAGTAKIIRSRDGSVLIAHCGVMETPSERMKGLLGRAGLPEEEGLWFPHETSVHTFFMKFAIDVAFLNRKGKVIALYHSLRPWRHTWIHLTALGGGTIEASPGLFAKRGIELGEELEVCPGA